MVSNLEKFTKYIFVLFLIDLVACKPSKNFWDVIGNEIGESVDGKPKEIGKYKETFCQIDNIQCYDCKDFKGDEETCRNFIYCWFNCLTNECLHKDHVAPNKYCSTYCQECSCLGDNKCTWDPLDKLCISSQCPDHLPFDNKKHCYFMEKYDRDRNQSAFVFDGRVCAYSSSELVQCQIIRSWTILDESAINIGSDGQFQITMNVWPEDELSEDIQTFETFYLSFNGMKILVKYPMLYGDHILYYLHFIVENGQPKITGFANKKPLEPLQDNTHLSLSISSSGNCEFGQISPDLEVVQLPEHWKCSGYRGNQCQCQQSFSGCRYIHGNKDCVVLEVEEDLQTYDYSFRYRCASNLDGEFYLTVRRCFVEDGKFREIDIHGNYGCKIQEKIIAVNINGEEFNDTNGIVHDAGSTVPPDDSTDAADFEVGDYGTSSCSNEYKSETFKTVYGTFAQGKIRSNDDLGKCLSYSFTVTSDGSYMLNVRIFDPNLSNSISDRMFDIKLNNIVVAGGINPFRLLWISDCAGFDISIYFEVSNGLKTVKMTSDSQIPDWEISNGQMTVGFCNSPCEGNSAFMVSAFSVARYAITEGVDK